MNNNEALEMMRRCLHEIKGLRSQIAALAPKAQAYDDIHIVLGLLPKPSQICGEDIQWTLETRIKELEETPKTQTLSHDQ